MHSLTDTTCDRLAKVLPRLGSDQDGEVIATVAAVGRILNRAGATWHDLAAKLAEPVTELTYIPDDQPVDWYDAAAFCFGCGRMAMLDDREREFVENMAARNRLREPSPKQIAWLESIFWRLQREEARHA